MDKSRTRNGGKRIRDHENKKERVFVQTLSQQNQSQVGPKRSIFGSLHMPKIDARWMHQTGLSRVSLFSAKHGA